MTKRHSEQLLSLIKCMRSIKIPSDVCIRKYYLYKISQNLSGSHLKYWRSENVLFRNSLGLISINSLTKIKVNMFKVSLECLEKTAIPLL